MRIRILQAKQSRVIYRNVETKEAGKDAGRGGFYMELAKVTSKGQVTIPIEIRKKLGIKNGDKDFSDIDIEKPEIMSPAQFMESFL